MISFDFDVISWLVFIIIFCVAGLIFTSFLDMIYHMIRFKWSAARYLNDNARPYFEKDVYDFIKEIRSK